MELIVGQIQESYPVKIGKFLRDFSNQIVAREIHACDESK
jgi:hypothetical protein